MLRATEPVTSATLLGRLKTPDDDRGAWPRFVRTYGPVVLAWCKDFGLREDDARDVTQEVLLRFYRQAGRFDYDPSRRFRGWLRTLTHAAWCDWVEQSRPWHEGSGDSKMRSLLELLPAPEGLAERLDREFDRERLERSMERVRAGVEPHTWEAFRLLALGGAEAAERLGMRVGSAHAARCKVQRLVRRELERLEAEDAMAAG